MAEASLPYKIESLSANHDRFGFTCGVALLDRYIATQATQDIRRRVSACFVAVDAGTAAIGGYYTLAATSIPLPDITAATAKKLPRYPLVSAVRLGRLAVSTIHRGKGLGAALLIDSITRALRAEIMAFALVADAKDDAALAFYRHHGFTAFESVPMSLYLPLSEAARHLGLGRP